jgi:cytoskeleton protein RodZ
MSELNVSDSPPDIADASEMAGLSAGAILRRAREAAGLHIAALAVSMKIPVKKLEALEGDRLELLHDAVFVRALAASVCRTLKIDAAPVLAKLPSNPAPRLTSGERGINQPFQSAGDKSPLSVPAILAKPQALIVFFLLAGIATVFFLPQDGGPDHGTERALQMPKMVEQSVSPASPLPEVAASDAVVVPTNAVPVRDKDHTADSTIEVQMARPAVSSPTPLGTNGIAGNAVGSRFGTIVFKAKASSWVKVVDSAGVVQLSKTLTDGEVASVSGTEPMSIVVGRADVVDVEVRGKAFSLTAIAKDNVARFEVK